MMTRKITALVCLLIAATAAVMAQPQLKPNEETLDLGQVEWKRPVTINYTITNTGSSALVLNAVEPDCACSVARWTDTPIAPRGNGQISVTFDAEALGQFRKSVAVYSNAEPHVRYLHFTGQVLEHVTDFSRTHPHLIGDIRLDTAAIVFRDVMRGQQPTMHISVANQGSNSYEPVIMHLPRYVSMTADPPVIGRGERADITLTLHSDRLSDYGLIESVAYLSRFTGDKVGDGNEIPVSVLLLPDFSAMTEQERMHPAVIQVSDTLVDMGTLLESRSKARYDITVSNTGEMPLYIPRVQVMDKAANVSLKKNLLQPGESTRLRITVNKRDITDGREPLEVLMVTTDYRRPKVMIKIKVG